ncbi:MAG: hypothetical protein IKA78_06410, partial [Oscillospiraceae bacterium]|nr:hypothetical protein [Oscillospiraceae bacterium]
AFLVRCERLDGQPLRHLLRKCHLPLHGGGIFGSLRDWMDNPSVICCANATSPCTGEAFLLRCARLDGNLLTEGFLFGNITR